MTPPSTSPAFPANVAVLGAGAVGCFFGGMLAQAGTRVTLIGRQAHVDAIARDGLVIVRNDGEQRVAVAATTSLAALAQADLVLVCVKSPDTETAARSAAPHLAPGTRLLSLQNGVDNAARLAAALPAHPVYAAVVYVGTSMEGPGRVRHAGRGDLVIGEPRAARGRGTAEDLAAMAAAFARAGVPCPVAPDIEAALWTKLAINCAFNAICALGRARYGRMAESAPVRALMEDAVREVVAVAQADGVALILAAELDKVWQVARAMPQQYSSTAQDLLRGKPTEIDALNGYVVARGTELGVATPVNRTLHALVKLLEGAPASGI